jgi:hypothetical protein
LKRTNSKLIDEIDIHFLQPTHNDISKDCVKNIVSYGATYTKIGDLSNKQKNTEVNYTNKCVTAEWFSENLKTEYMCWLDLDVLFLQNIDSDFFKSTDKIVLTLYDTDSKYWKEFDPNGLYSYYKDYLPEMYRVESVKKYVSSWFIYGKTKNKFWKEWKKLTYILLDIVHENYYDKFNSDGLEMKWLESNCEEMASMIMYTKNPELFIDIREFYGNNALSFIEANIDNDQTLRCSENTVIYHYNNMAGLLQNDLPKYEYKKTAIKSILSVLDAHEIPDLTVKDIFLLGK